MISIVIPTYNRAKTLSKSVKSVLQQTYTDLECIVIDDGSKDNTEEVIGLIKDRRLRYFRSRENLGACAARNKGIELAQGDFIAFQDSDDVWHVNKLELQLNALLTVGADVCFCRKHRIGVNLDDSDITHEDLKEGIVPYELLYSRPLVSTQTILARKSVFEEFRFDEKVQKAQDYEWSIRAGEKYKFFFIAEALVDQYMQNDSITARGEKDYRIEKETCQYFYDKFKDKYNLYPNLEIALLKRFAMFKTLSGDNSSKEYKNLYEITGNKKFLIEYILEKTRINILQQWFKFRRQEIKRLL